MYLRSVEIDGFKSFAENVRVNFDTGITAIVGPNGSGKSNILDATLWVLGEQSYKNIRAKESLDVIFSGGKNKNPKNKAEVSLHIDNSDGTLSIEEESVKITRRLHRTGENEYLINNRKARLKDIHELFMDTGVGKSAYSVIGQGKVERIISSSSKEIREIIEEAAGIKKVKIKKVEAEKKLGKVEDEIEKINLIIGELEENKNKIEKQASKAIKYSNLVKEKEKLAKGINIFELSRERINIEILEEDIQNQREKISKKQESFEESEENLEKINNLREKLTGEIEHLTEKNINLKKDLDKLINDKTLFTERKKSYEREVKEKAETKVRVEEKLKFKIKEIEDINISYETLEEEVQEQLTEQGEFEELIKGKEEEKKRLQVEVGIKKDKLMTYEVDRLKHISDAENTVKRLKSSKTRIEDLEREVVEYRELLKKEEERYTEKKKFLDEKTIEYNGIDKKVETLEGEITVVSQKMSSLYEEMREIDYNLKRHDGKLENLKKLDANNEGFYKGVKEVLNKGIDGVVGAFISLVEIPERYEKAIEAAIPGNLQDIIVRDSSVAKRCIEHLKVSRSGRASFLALDTIRGSREQVVPSLRGVIGLGSKLLNIDVRYQKVLENLLGGLLIVEDIEVALEVSKKNLFRGNIVTLSGELISSRGRITGGENTRSLTSQILERKKEIEKLQGIVLGLREKHSIIEEKYNSLTSQMEKTEEKLLSLDDLKDSLKVELKRWAEELDDLKRSTEKIEKNLRIVDLEAQEERNYIKEYKEVEKTAKDKKEEIETLMQNLKDELERKNQVIVQVDREINDFKDKFSDKRIRFLNNKERLRQYERDINREKSEKRELEGLLNSLTSKVSELKSGIEKLEESLKKLENSYLTDNSRYEKDYIEVKEKRKEYSQLEKDERELIKLVKDIEKSIVIENSKLSNILEKHEKSQINLEKLLEISKELIEIVDFDEIEDLKVSKDDLLRLEARIKNLGIVNLLAINEFEEVKKKYEFIVEQRSDLLTSERSLRQLIKDIENIVEMKFIETYKAINKNFGYMCREILDNSEGKLELTKPDEILETGIELLVKFKNKRRQSITLLSGGEKSMVAVAFIMGIFMYKPSPFTFFDEIEAALDELNTKRLIAKLKEFTDKSQFILITHNKETMREADRLYGVTMNKEVGESKVLSVEMSR